MDTKEQNIKNLVNSSLLKADDKLKVRIMQQITTEEALSPIRKKKATSTENVFLYLGIFYAIILGSIFYFTNGLDFRVFSSISFLATTTSLLAIFSLFWLISNFDNYRLNKRQSNPSNKTE
ncbi:MAG: hypothetical protein M9897_05490 [Brumimicrobium sp.]|nr:hypothetical protein [Brumimicrobium sp.]